MGLARAEFPDGMNRMARTEEATSKSTARTIRILWLAVEIPSARTF